MYGRSMKDFLKRAFVKYKTLGSERFPEGFLVELRLANLNNLDDLLQVRKEKLRKLHTKRVSLQKQKKGFYLLAFVEKELVGYVYISLTGTEKYHSSPVLQDLYVKIDLREQGIGSKIIRAAEEFLMEQGYTKVSLDVETKNKWIKNIYEKLGFKKVSGPHLQRWTEVDSGKEVKVETWYLEKSLRIK